MKIGDISKMNYLESLDKKKHYLLGCKGVVIQDSFLSKIAEMKSIIDFNSSSIDLTEEEFLMNVYNCFRGLSLMIFKKYKVDKLKGDVFSLNELNEKILANDL